MPYDDDDDGRWYGLRICITSFDGKYKCCLFLNMMYQVCGMSNIHKHQLHQKDISKNLRMLSEIMSFGFFCKVLLTTKKSPISTLFFLLCGTKQGVGRYLLFVFNSIALPLFSSHLLLLLLSFLGLVPRPPEVKVRYTNKKDKLP